jgi:hypothetical protein
VSRQTPVRHARTTTARRRVPIIALLVGLAAVPMVVAVLAGSASLDGSDRPRRPFVAGPPDGPVTIGPSPDDGSAPAPGPGDDLSRRDRSFGDAKPGRPLSPESPVAPSPGTAGGSGGGSGGGPGGAPIESTCTDSPQHDEPPSSGPTNAGGETGQGSHDAGPPDGMDTPAPSTGPTESSDGGLVGGLLRIVGGLVG